MPLKRKGTSAFRGPTPPKVFQTVDVGSGRGKYIIRQARKFPHRKYAAIDPLYKPPKKTVKLLTPHISAMQQAARELEQLGVHVHAGNLSSFIAKMIQAGYKTRHFNIDMPSMFQEKKFEMLLEQIPNILLPKGKNFVTTEFPNTLTKLETLAKKYGLRFRQLIPLTTEQALEKTNVTRMFAKVYQSHVSF